MEILRGEFLSVSLELCVGRFGWHALEVHVFKVGEQIPALAMVTCDAGGDDILPIGLAVAAARDDMIEGELMGREAGAAILARKIVAHEDVEPRKGRALDGHRLVLLETNNTRQGKYHAGTPDSYIVCSHNRNPIQKNGLDDILPRPQRERHIGQWGEVCVEHKGGAGLRAEV